MYFGREAAEDSPEMPTGCDAVWAAFWHLESARSVRVYGVSTQVGTTIESVPIGIPFPAIDGYAMRFGIAGEDFDRFFRLISEMDREYLKFHIEKMNERFAKQR